MRKGYSQQVFCMSAQGYECLRGLAIKIGATPMEEGNSFDLSMTF